MQSLGFNSRDAYSTQLGRSIATWHRGLVLVGAHRGRERCCYGVGRPELALVRCKGVLVKLTCLFLWPEKTSEREEFLKFL